jgi:hypothetical protein
MDSAYVRMMYAEKKWAFVSDYIRFRALESFGGLYLDCDVEVLRDLSPVLESGPLVARSKSMEVQSAVLAFPPHHPMIIYILSLYDLQARPDISFTSPIAVQTALETGQFPDVIVRDAELFFPADEGEALTENARATAYTNHLWAESWVPAARLRKFARRTGIMPMIKKVKILLRWPS